MACVDEDKQNFELKKFIKIFQACACQTWLDIRVVLSFTCHTRQKKSIHSRECNCKERETHDNKKRKKKYNSKTELYGL